MHEAERSILPPASVAQSAASNSSANTVLAIPWTATWILLLTLAALLNAGLIAISGGSRGYYLLALSTLVCLLAALLDAFTRRIPNQLTYTAIVLGVSLNALAPLLHLLHAQAALTWLGAAGPADSLLGLVVCGFLALAANLLAGIHGGDLKLLAAMGALLGLSVMSWAALLALLIALIYSLVNLAFFGRLNRVAQIGSQRALELFFLRRFQTPAPDAPASAVSHIPMAVPMALAILGVVWMQFRPGRGGFFW